MEREKSFSLFQKITCMQEGFQDGNFADCRTAVALANASAKITCGKGRSTTQSISKQSNPVFSLLLRIAHATFPFTTFVRAVCDNSRKLCAYSVRFDRITCIFFRARGTRAFRLSR